MTHGRGADAVVAYCMARPTALYRKMAIGTLAVDGRAVTFETARRGLTGAGATNTVLRDRYRNLRDGGRVPPATMFTTLRLLQRQQQVY